MLRRHGDSDRGNARAGRGFRLLLASFAPSRETDLPQLPAETDSGVAIFTTDGLMPSREGEKYAQRP
jgi:hypothetical protein